MTGTVEQALNAARSQIGYNGEGSCGAPVTKFGTWAGVQTQWCAIFVSWCLYEADVPRLGRFTYGEDYCPAWVSLFKSVGRWYSTPKPGDAVFYSWDRNGVAEHVGLVEAVNTDGTITTIEGNTDDPTIAGYACGNCCRRKRRNMTYVMGFGRPPYAITSPAAHAATPLPAESENEMYLVRPDNDPNVVGLLTEKGIAVISNPKTVLALRKAGVKVVADPIAAENFASLVKWGRM